MSDMPTFTDYGADHLKTSISLSQALGKAKKILKKKDKEKDEV